MERKDLLKVYAFAGAVWSSFKLPKTDLELKLQSEVWFTKLAPYPVSFVLAAIDEYAKENDFCNISKVAALCDKYTQMQNGTYIDEEETLEHIQKAVSYEFCKENFAKLTPFEKELVGGPHMLAKWARLNDFETVVMSNLRKKVHNKLTTRKFENTLKTIEKINAVSNKFIEGDSYGR